MIYYKPDFRIFAIQPKRIYDYLSEYQIITDATCPDLNDDSLTTKRLQPVYDYLEENSMKIIYSGGFRSDYGAFYYLFDVTQLTTDQAHKQANAIIDLYQKNWSDFEWS